MGLKSLTAFIIGAPALVAAQGLASQAKLEASASGPTATDTTWTLASLGTSFEALKKDTAACEARVQKVNSDFTSLQAKYEALEKSIAQNYLTANIAAQDKQNPNKLEAEIDERTAADIEIHERITALDSKLTSAIDAEVSARIAAIAAEVVNRNSAIAAETERAEAAELAINELIDSAGLSILEEVDDAIAAAITIEENARIQDVNDEEDARIAAIATEVEDRNSAIDSAGLSILEEVDDDIAAAMTIEENARIQDVDDEEDARIAAIATEVEDRNSAIAAEVVNRNSAIASEVSARIASINNEVINRNSAIANEVVNRNSAIASEVSARIASINNEVFNRNSAIATEVVNRNSAIASEVSARIAAIDNEVVNRNSAIEIEVNARIAAIAKEVADRNSAIEIEAGNRIFAVLTEAGQRRDAISKEIFDRNNAILVETNRARAAEQALGSQIDSLDLITTEDVTDLIDDAITIEQNARIEDVNAEENARIAAISTEVEDRNAAIEVESVRALDAEIFLTNNSVVPRKSEYWENLDTLNWNVNGSPSTIPYSGSAGYNMGKICVDQGATLSLTVSYIYRSADRKDIYFDLYDAIGEYAYITKIYNPGPTQGETTFNWILQFGPGSFFEFDFTVYNLSGNRPSPTAPGDLKWWYTVYYPPGFPAFNGCSSFSPFPVFTAP